MSERWPDGLDSNPNLLTPEYWDGHGVDDDCPWPNLPVYEWPTNPKQIRKARQFGEEVLESYLATPERTVTRVFAAGELFESRDYPEGTIIYYEREEAILRHTPAFKQGSFFGKLEASMLKPYLTDEYWGVVCRWYKDGQPKKTIMRYTENARSSGGVYSWGLPEIHPSIRIGNVQHTRSASTGSDFLKRVTRLEVHQIGSGVREKVKQPRLLRPRLGVSLRGVH